MTSTSRIIACATASALMASTATGALAASHREAPGITLSPKIDGTDFYMFRSYEAGREDYVTFIANYQPLQSPYGGPNYFTMDDDAIYEIHIDNDGDAIEDVTFRFDFTNILKGQTVNAGGVPVAIPLRQSGPIDQGSVDGANEIETYTLDIVRGDRRSGDVQSITNRGNGRSTFRKALDYYGEKSFPNYENYANSRIYNADVPGCNGQSRVFVGQRAEGFAVNLGEIFDLVNTVPIEGDSERGAGDGGGFPGGITQSRTNDDLIGTFNITSLAIEVPIACVTSDDSPIIGAWTTASLPQTRMQDPLPTYDSYATYGGAFVQRSRLSAPLVNEVVIGLPDKNLFNAAEPIQDSALATYVTNPALPELIEALFGLQAPNNFPRNDLVAAFLTGFPGFNQPEDVVASEMMRLNTDVPPTDRDDQSPFGVVGEDLAGFPNGRRPGDDVVDIALRVVMGRLCYRVPLGAELTGDPSIEDTDDDSINLGLCRPADAPDGNRRYTDGAPVDATLFGAVFPYLNTPIPGSPGSSVDMAGEDHDDSDSD